MKLTLKQISKIKQKILFVDKTTIVRIDVSEDDDMPSEESSFNIYRINERNEIVWQVKEIKTKVPFGDDMFVHLGMNDKNEIIAYRFSGFEYRIDPETGEAEQIGFHK